MEDDVKTLSDYASIAWYRKFYILVPFVLVLFVTFPMVMMLPPGGFFTLAGPRSTHDADLRRSIGPRQRIWVDAEIAKGWLCTLI